MIILPEASLNELHYHTITIISSHNIAVYTCSCDTLISSCDTLMSSCDAQMSLCDIIIQYISTCWNYSPNMKLDSSIERSLQEQCVNRCTLSSMLLPSESF